MWVNYIAVYVPIVMYGLRLFIVEKNYQIVYMFVWSELEVAITSPSFITLYLMVSEIAKYIAWGCLLLFCKNLFTKLFTCLYDQS